MKALICLVIGHSRFIYTKYLARPKWDTTPPYKTPGIPVLGCYCLRCGKEFR